MSKNNWVALIAALCVTPCVFADTEITVKEARQLQAQVWKAEQEAKLREAQNRGNNGQPGAPNVQISSSVPADDIAFVGHYGVENDLKADFLLNGSLLTLSLVGKSEVAGWHLDALTPMFARICKRNVGGKNANCKEIPLASDRSALTKSATSTSGDSSRSITVPPIRSISIGTR